MSINSDIMCVIKEHMELQPYAIFCKECGRDLQYDVTIDKDLDLKIVVYLCDCQKK